MSIGVCSFVKHVHFGTNIQERLLNKPYVNEVTLTGQNPSLKCYQPLELLTAFKNGLRSFNAENLKSLGQRPAKLPVIKL